MEVCFTMNEFETLSINGVGIISIWHINNSAVVKKERETNDSHVNFSVESYFIVLFNIQNSHKSW